jgi:hypothetical protein
LLQVGLSQQKPRFSILRIRREYGQQILSRCPIVLQLYLQLSDFQLVLNFGRPVPEELFVDCKRFAEPV